MEERIKKIESDLIEFKSLIKFYDTIKTLSPQISFTNNRAYDLLFKVVGELEEELIKLKKP